MRAFDRGRAFLIGDGTGQAKGRESMGVIASHCSAAARVARSSSRRAASRATCCAFNDCRVAEAFPGTTFFDASGAAQARRLSSRAVIFTTYSQIRSPQRATRLCRTHPGQGQPAGGHAGAGRGAQGMSNNTATYKEIEKLIEASPDSPLLC